MKLIQVYAKEISGIEYLKTIGVYNPTTHAALFNWFEVSSHAKKLFDLDEDSDIKLYINSNRVYLVSWTEHVWGKGKETITLKNASFIMESK